MPSRSSSRADTSAPAPIPSAHFSTMASRCSGAGVSLGRALWGGMAAGMSSSLSSPRAATAAFAAAMCPRWGGLKVPP